MTVRFHFIVINQSVAIQALSSILLATVTSTSENGEGLPALQETAITAKMGLHVEINLDSLDYD
jgi:hypothetical protein